jgi:putative nucleotidyltransferase with HDIG domain
MAYRVWKTSSQRLIITKKENTVDQSNKVEKIKECFPILGKMKDQIIKETVIRCWVRMWEESKWKDLTDCPFTPPFPEISLVQHVNCVGDLVLAAADIIERHNPHLNLDRDFLITGVLLHDLSKLVEIEKGSEGVLWGKLLKVMPHSTYGAFTALAEGLPLRVANIIMSHTRMTNTLPASPEAVLLHYIDYGLADVLRAERGLQLILDGGPKLGK